MNHDATINVDTERDQNSGVVESDAPDWPDTWRERLADGDAKSLRQLQRHAAPDTVAKSWWYYAQKYDEQQDAKADVLSEDEYIAEFPQINGLDELTSNGIAALLTFVHNSALPPSCVKDLVSGYIEDMNIAKRDMARKDAENRLMAMNELRKEWGIEYDAKLAAARTMLATRPSAEALVRALHEGRLQDGKILSDHVDMIRFIGNIAMELSPTVTMPGISSMNSGSASMDHRISEIESMMNSKNGPYWRNDSGVQDEYRDLIETRNKLSRRR